jgi:hypothetical protein
VPSDLLHPLHLGGLHPFEQVLTLVLAFGPFLLLGVLIAVRRGQDRAEQAGEAPASGPGPQRDR